MRNGFDLHSDRVKSLAQIVTVDLVDAADDWDNFCRVSGRLESLIKRAMGNDLRSPYVDTISRMDPAQDVNQQQALEILLKVARIVAPTLEEVANIFERYQSFAILGNGPQRVLEGTEDFLRLRNFTRYPPQNELQRALQLSRVKAVASAVGVQPEHYTARFFSLEGTLADVMGRVAGAICSACEQINLNPNLNQDNLRIEATPLPEGTNPLHALVKIAELIIPGDLRLPLYPFA